MKIIDICIESNPYPHRRPDASAPDYCSAAVASARRFHLSLNPPKESSLAVVCGGLEHTTPQYSIHRNPLPLYSIEYVIGGKGEVKLNGRSGTLQAGRIFSCGPDVRMDLTGDPSDPLVKYFVGFVGTQALDHLRSCGLAPGSLSQIFPANAMQPLFDELVQTGLRVHPGSSLLCAKILECLTLKINIAKAPIEGANTLAFSTYEHCRQYIEEHFQRLRTLEQVSEECHISNAYLCRLFRRYEQQSPYAYLMRIKMNCAAELLQQESILVKQAAEQVGFEDAFLFSRRFKSVFGVSPKDFRGLACLNPPVRPT